MRYKHYSTTTVFLVTCAQIQLNQKPCLSTHRTLPYSCSLTPTLLHSCAIQRSHTTNTSDSFPKSMLRALTSPYAQVLPHPAWTHRPTTNCTIFVIDHTITGWRRQSAHYRLASCSQGLGRKRLRTPSQPFRRVIARRGSSATFLRWQAHRCAG